MSAMALYYDQILAITAEYLGPAAGRFVNRQINSYFHKPPAELQKGDIPMLAIRIRSGLSVLTKDNKVVEEAFQRISAVGDSYYE
jgi:hypothetical protein